MIRCISKIRNRYYLPLITALLGAFSVVVAVMTGGLVGIKVGVNVGTKKNLTEKKTNVFDVVHELRVKFAADHGVANPAALVEAVRHSPMADLLISVAIEESSGDPAAVGTSGEQGAWQVMASHWGAVPKDIRGQAGQAEQIISGLLIRTNGNKKKALARYNGGTLPTVKSYRYAERILKRANHLQIAVNHLLPNYRKFRVALIDPPGGNSRSL
jgi:Transglycosylase SLT domain